MIAVDTNILVYAHRVESAFHERAREALVELMAQGNGWSIPWPCVHEFLATVTNTRFTPLPTNLDVALEQMSELMRDPRLTLLGEAPGHFTTLSELVLAANSRGGAIHDARIASICIDHGVSELWTADRDFRRFPGLRLRNPLA